MRRAGWIAVVLGGTALAAMMLAAGGGERKIEHRLERLYETDDPQFRRSMGALLGPPIVDGNQVETLLNGDEIFPRCWQAIRARTTHDHLRDLHLLVGRRSATSSPTRWPSAPAPASRCTCCSTGSAATRWTTS